MIFRRLLAAFALFALFGCGKLTLDNYKQIKVGMPYEQVVKLIGKPASCDDLLGLRNCVWEDGASTVKVNFAGEQVLLFSSTNLR